MFQWFFNLFRRKHEKARSEPYINERSESYATGRSQRPPERSVNHRAPNVVRSGRVSAAKPNPSSRPVSSHTHQTHIPNFIFPDDEHARRSSCETRNTSTHTPIVSHACSSHRSSGGESYSYGDSGGDSGGGGGCD